MNKSNPMQNNATYLDALRGWCLCLTIMASALLFSFSFVSFLHPKELAVAAGTVLVTLSLMLRHLIYRHEGHNSPVLMGISVFLPLWAGLVTVVVVGLVLLPVQVPAHVAEEGLRLSSLLLLVTCSMDLLSQPGWRTRVVNALILSAVSVGLLGIGQYHGFLEVLFPVFEGYNQPVYSVFGNQDLFGGYLAMAVPFLCARLVRRPLQDKSGPSRLNMFTSTVFLGIILSGLLLSECRSAWLAAFVGAIVALPYGRFHKGRLGLVAATVVFIGLLTVVPRWSQFTDRVMGTFGSEDVGGSARLWFWDGTLHLIRVHPWTGVGLGNYAYWSPRYLGEALVAPGGEAHYHNELHTMHAHCEVLEWQAETGVLGLVFMVWMIVRVSRRVITKCGIRANQATLGALITLIIFALFNAAFHSAPHALTALILVALLLATPDKGTLRTGSYEHVHNVSAAVLALFIGFGLWWTVLTPSRLLCTAEATYLKGDDALPGFERLFDHGWPYAAAREKYGLALLDAGQNKAAREQFALALKGMDTGGLYLSLGMLAYEEKDLHQARRYFQACLNRWPANNTAFQHLLKLSTGEERQSLLAHGRRWGQVPKAS
jgi:O-antigen ligase